MKGQNGFMTPVGSLGHRLYIGVTLILDRTSFKFGFTDNVSEEGKLGIGENHE